MSIKLWSAVALLFAMVVVGILALTGTFSQIPSDTGPLNNGYPGWSNKVQPW